MDTQFYSSEAEPLYIGLNERSRYVVANGDNLTPTTEFFNDKDELVEYLEDNDLIDKYDIDIDEID